MIFLLRLLLPISCVLALASCGEGIDLSALAQSRANGQFERTLPVTGPVELNVRTGSGDINVRVGSDDRVQVVGRITAGNRRSGDSAAERVSRIEADPPVRQAGNLIHIGDTSGDPRFDNVSITYELVVPANTRLLSQTGSGDQLIGSLDGSIDAKAGSGDIEVERAGGGLDAEAGSGDVRARAVGGAVRVQVGSGSVDVSQSAPGDVAVQTGSGDVSVRLPPGAGVTLALRTGSGSIESALPIQLQGEIRRNRLEGIVRGGGASVDIATGSGSIRIQ